MIETDHAPHSSEEKEYAEGKDANSYASGIRSMDGYANFIMLLRTELHVPESTIIAMTYSNQKEIYKNKKLVE